MCRWVFVYVCKGELVCGEHRYGIYTCVCVCVFPYLQDTINAGALNQTSHSPCGPYQPITYSSDDLITHCDLSIRNISGTCVAPPPPTHTHTQTLTHTPNTMSFTRITFLTSWLYLILIRLKCLSLNGKKSVKHSLRSAGQINHFQTFCMYQK